MDTPRLEELVERFLDRDLSEPETGELAEAVRASTDVRERVLDHLVLANALSHTLRQRDLWPQVLAALRDRSERDHLTRNVLACISSGTGDEPPASARREGRSRSADLHQRRFSSTAHRRRNSSARWTSRRRGKMRVWLRHVVLPLAAVAAFLAIVHVYNLKTIADAQAALCAEIIEVRGEVHLDAAPARVGGEVRPGREIRAGSGGRTRLEYQDGTVIELREESSLRLLINPSRKDASKALRLERGEFIGEVARQAPGAPMRIETPHAGVEVIGTRFALAAEPRFTWLEVEHGRVRLTRSGDGASIEVAAGQYAIAGAGRPLTARPLVEMETVHVFAEADAVVESGKDAGRPYEPAIPKPHLAVAKYGSDIESLESFLRFDLSSVEGKIARAVLRLYPAPVSPDKPHAGRHAAAFVADDGWDENSVTWLAKPASFERIGEWDPRQEKVVCMDVTALARREREGDGKISVRLYGVAPAESGAWYGAREGRPEMRPKMVVEVEVRASWRDLKSR